MLGRIVGYGSKTAGPVAAYKDWYRLTVEQAL